MGILTLKSMAMAEKKMPSTSSSENYCDQKHYDFGYTPMSLNFGLFCNYSFSCDMQSPSYAE